MCADDNFRKQNPFYSLPPDGSEEEIVISTEPSEMLVLALVGQVHMKGLLNTHSTRHQGQTETSYWWRKQDNKICPLKLVVIVGVLFVTLKISHILLSGNSVDFDIIQYICIMKPSTVTICMYNEALHCDNIYMYNKALPCDNIYL